MGCRKGGSEETGKEAKFTCGKCGVKFEKKGHACKPVKLKGEKKDCKKDCKKEGKKSGKKKG